MSPNSSTLSLSLPLLLSLLLLSLDDEGFAGCFPLGLYIGLESPSNSVNTSPLSAFAKAFINWPNACVICLSPFFLPSFKLSANCCLNDLAYNELLPIFNPLSSIICVFSVI